MTGSRNKRSRKTRWEYPTGRRTVALYLRIEGFGFVKFEKGFGPYGSRQQAALAQQELQDAGFGTYASLSLHHPDTVPFGSTLAQDMEVSECIRRAAVLRYMSPEKVAQMRAALNGHTVRRNR